MAIFGLMLATMVSTGVFAAQATASDFEFSVQPEVTIPDAAPLTATVTQSWPAMNPWVSIEDEDTGQRVQWCGLGVGTYSCTGYHHANWGEQDDPHQHHYYARLWHVVNGVVTPGARSQTETVTVEPADLSVTLEAESTSVLWHDHATLTATASRDAASMPYDIAIYDAETGTQLQRCTTGTTCTAYDNYYDPELNLHPEPQRYVAKLVRSGYGSVPSDEVTVDVRRRTFPVTLTLSSPYLVPWGRYGMASVAGGIVGPYRLMLRQADGDVEHTCSMGYASCQSGWLDAGESYRATVEDLDGNVFGESALYTVGPDDSEALTFDDLDVGHLAELLAPWGVGGVCDELLLRNDLGTHVLGSTTSDQWIACDTARTAGKSLLDTLVAIGRVAGSGGVLWYLYHEGLDEQTDTPPQHDQHPVPEPVRVPPVFPISWPVDDLASDLLERNPELTQREADVIARTCLWLTSHAALNGAQKCRSLPIFASGSDVAEATQHDLEALSARPIWLVLNYEYGATKPNSGWQTDLCDPARYGPPSSATSIHSSPPSKAVQPQRHFPISRRSWRRTMGCRDRSTVASSARVVWQPATRSSRFRSTQARV